jgi:hypothetical protein
MDDGKVDRLARAFAKTSRRRWLVALAGGAMGVLGQRVAIGSQLGPTTCGEEGAVCTLVSGCCDGLTCVTSAINTSYGICVPGEGGMVSTGTTLISPFSETAVEEATALMETASTAPTTDPQADQEARLAATRARKDAKSTEKRTRLDTKRSEQRLRKDERKADRRAKQSLRPRLSVELGFKVVGSDPIEVVEVTNRDDFDVVLTRIETIEDRPDGVSLIAPQITLGPNKSFSFVSGLQPEEAADIEDNEYGWKSNLVCDGDAVPGDGYRLLAAFSLDAKNYSYTVRCDGRHKKKKR